MFFEDAEVATIQQLEMQVRKIYASLLVTQEMSCAPVDLYKGKISFKLHELTFRWVHPTSLSEYSPRAQR